LMICAAIIPTELPMALSEFVLEEGRPIGTETDGGVGDSVDGTTTRRRASVTWKSVSENMPLKS